MDGLKVSELAERTGVPASTVRYYEGEGLLPARRSPSGYRLYDNAALERLSFIGTAKSLGLSLSEIRPLLKPWEHGSCADVQSELEPLLERYLVDTDEQITELREFAARLQQARRQLAAIDRDGPCDPSCAFLGQRRPSGSALTLLELPPTAADTEVVACTLDGNERVERVKRWRRALRPVTARTPIARGVRLTLDRTRVCFGEMAELAAAEADCCRFFEISMQFGDPPTMDVQAPENALVLVHDLFGTPGP